MTDASHNGDPAPSPVEQILENTAEIHTQLAASIRSAKKWAGGRAMESLPHFVEAVTRHAEATTKTLLEVLDMLGNPDDEAK